VPDLAPLADIAGIALQGQASARSRIRSDDIRRTATASTDATFTELLPLDNPLMALAGPMVSVAGAFEFDAGRHWAVRELTVTGTSAVLNANATVSADATRLDGDYRLTVPELAVLSAIVQTPLAGKLTVAGEVGGSAADPTLTARITLPSLAVDDVVVGSGDARVSFTRLRSGVAGEVDVSVDDERIGAVALSSRFSGDPRDTLRFDGLVLESRDASLAGSMTIGLSDKTVTGQLVGQAIPLAPWSDLAGRALTGSARVALDMRGGKTQQLDLALTASEVTVALGPRRTLDVGAVDATARVEDVFGTPTGGLRAVATDAKIPDARFASVILEAKLHDRRRSSARLQARGELNTPFELEVIADYEAHDRGFVVTVSTLDASIAGQAVALTKPARIARHAGTTTLSKSTISIAGGHLVADGRLGVDVIEANLELERIALAALDAVAPLADVTGSLSGHARVSGARSAPAGVLDLRIADVRSAHTTLAVAPPASGRLSGDWRDGRLHLDATLAEVADTSIQARASMPLRLEPESLALSMPRDEAVDGELRWSGELGPVWDLLSPYEDRFTGPGDLALDLAGTVGSPQASGHFQVTGGRYENVQSGTTLIDVDLRLVGDGDKLVVEKLTGSDGKAGTLEGGGAIDFLPARDYPTNLHLRFSDMLLVARDDLILNASGSFALEGTFSNALLSGEIITGNSELSLAGTLPPEVVELDVQEVNITDAARARESSAQSTADPSIVILDLDVSVPGRAFVRGLGLDSEWRGEVKISGDARAPNVAGILQPVRGHFSLMGKRFTLEQGTIRFTGSDDVDPLLDLTAEHKTANLTAMVRVTGSASQPDVSLSSRPPLPESEIASQVLFGTDSSNLSAAQSLQLASAIATYSGRGGAVGILDSTRRALGVDVIGFAESEQDPDKTRVSVGKYVADGVYIEVEAGAEESSRTSTTVEVEVLPDVRIEGGTTEQGGNKVGVKWKWDY
jgi:translocation and assembly module TamB